MKIRDFLPLLVFSVLLFIGTLAVPLLAFFDSLNPGLFAEESWTEHLQWISLCVTSVIFVYLFWKEKTALRAIQLMAGAFFAMMMLRELDAFWDKAVCHGFWKVPVLLVAGGSILYSFRRYTLRELTQAFLRFAKGAHSGAMLVGLMMVMVFSRLIGIKSLWRNVFTHINRYLNTSLSPLFGAAQEGQMLTQLTEFGEWKVGADMKLLTESPAAELLGLMPEMEALPEGFPVAGVDFPIINLDFRVLKNMVEETTELYGYFLIFAATVFYLLSQILSKKDNALEK